MDIPGSGYFRRANEQAVLPHAIGCQAPTDLSEYITILKGQHGLEFLFISHCTKRKCP